MHKTKNFAIIQVQRNKEKMTLPVVDQIIDTYVGVFWSPVLCFVFVYMTDCQRIGIKKKKKLSFFTTIFSLTVNRVISK